MERKSAVALNQEKPDDFRTQKKTEFNWFILHFFAVIAFSPRLFNHIS